MEKDTLLPGNIAICTTVVAHVLLQLQLIGDGVEPPNTRLQYRHEIGATLRAGESRPGVPRVAVLVPHHLLHGSVVGLEIDRASPSGGASTGEVAIEMRIRRRGLEVRETQRPVHPRGATVRPAHLLQEVVLVDVVYVDKWDGSQKYRCDSRAESSVAGHVLGRMPVGFVVDEFAYVTVGVLVENHVFLLGWLVGWAVSLNAERGAVVCGSVVTDDRRGCVLSVVATRSTRRTRRTANIVSRFVPVYEESKLPDYLVLAVFLFFCVRPTPRPTPKPVASAMRTTTAMIMQTFLRLRVLGGVSASCSSKAPLTAPKAARNMSHESPSECSLAHLSRSDEDQLQTDDEPLDQILGRVHDTPRPRRTLATIFKSHEQRYVPWNRLSKTFCSPFCKVEWS